MTVLVDTSVWVDHFRRSNPELTRLLVLDRVATHPMVVLEIACGAPPAPRARTLADLKRLGTVQSASYAEVHEFIEREKLYDTGCGLVEMMLLASTLITPSAKLWTLDRHLMQLAQRYAVRYATEMH